MSNLLREGKLRTYNNVNILDCFVPRNDQQLRIASIYDDCCYVLTKELL
jgi:hypothetical protein